MMSQRMYFGGFGLDDVLWMMQMSDVAPRHMTWMREHARHEGTEGMARICVEDGIGKV